MKTFSTLLFAGLLLASSCEKEECNDDADISVPAAVRNAFTSEYPNAKSVEWDMEGANYEAEFIDESTEKAIVYTPEAAVVYRANEVAVSSLPGRIAEYVSANYAGYEIEEAERIEQAEGTVQYEVEIEKGDKEMELLFDANGAFEKELADDEDDDEDD